MRNALLLLAVAVPLAACSTPSSRGTASAETPSQADEQPARCNPQALEALVGKTASTAVVEQAVRDVGAKNARVVKPGMAVTMDFREDRLTLSVDANNVIERAGCN